MTDVASVPAASLSSQQVPSSPNLVADMQVAVNVVGRGGGGGAIEEFEGAERDVVHLSSLRCGGDSLEDPTKVRIEEVVVYRCSPMMDKGNSISDVNEKGDDEMAVSLRLGEECSGD